MVLRYEKGLSPQAVADQLMVSLRHYYRVQKAAIQDVASVLWDRHIVRPTTPLEMRVTQAEASPGPVDLNRLELLRLEAAHASQAERYARVADVVKGVLPLLQEMLRQHGIEVQLALPESLSGVYTDRNLLRQMLLGMLGYLIDLAGSATIWLSGEVEGSSVCVSLEVEPPGTVHAMPQAESDERLLALDEMATLADTHISPIRSGPSIVGFRVRLPIAERTVLVVDDNEDVLELFRSYLRRHEYRVLTARTVHDALEKARQFQPYAITLDLMMPERDGWDLLQSLLNQPDTRHIPILVCSVLKQKELSLSLGATAFLEKPITEQALASALEALQKT
jgi:CheY-like chemotaxis protein